MSDGTHRALLVVNSTFPADRSNLPELEGPRNDPVVLQAALCHETTGLFLGTDVRVVAERPMAAVLSEVEDFLRTATRRETLLLYYSGHGMLDLRSELFLCTHDSRMDRLRSTAVKASDLRAMMDESAAGAIVVVLDCCHSGRFKGGDLPASLAGRGRFVLTSTRSGELANDTHVRNHASVFTHSLAEGLVHGALDHNRDGLVTLDDLYGYVHATLVGEGRPTPQKRFEGDGDVVIARRPTGPPPVIHMEAAPVLDLSDTVVDLGEVDVDEPLQPERIAVINRGGGSLDWTVETSADWVSVVADDVGVLLHLRPVPGPNRANVYVRDTRTRAMKTIRVIVRVRTPRTPPVELSPSAQEPSTSGKPPPLSKPPKPDEPPVSTAEPCGLPTSDEPAVRTMPRADLAPVANYGIISGARTILGATSRDIRGALGAESRWNVQNSSWLVLTLPLGFTTWAAFLIVGVQARRPRWILASVAYLVALTAIGVLFITAPDSATGQTDTDTWQANVGTAATLLLWVGGIAHGLLINRTWLERRRDIESKLRPPPFDNVWHNTAPLTLPVDATTEVSIDRQDDY